MSARRSVPRAVAWCLILAPLACACACSATARRVSLSAQDASAPAAPGPDIRDPGPDYGYIPNSAQIVPPGRWYLETSVVSLRGGDAQGTSYSLPLLFRIGVAKDWEVRALGYALQVEDRPEGRVAGAGPVELGFKHRFTELGDGPLEPSFGFEGELFLPVSSGGFDDGKVEPAVFFNVDHQMTQAGTLTWNVGLFTPVKSTGAQFAQGFVAWAYNSWVGRDLQLYATGSLNYPTETDGAQSILGGGLYWYFARRIVLVAGYTFGLNGESPDSGVLGLTFAF